MRGTRSAPFEPRWTVRGRSASSANYDLADLIPRSEAPS